MKRRVYRLILFAAITAFVLSLSPSVKAESNDTQNKQNQCIASDKETHPQKLEDERSEANVYKDNVDNLKFALTVILGLIAAFITFAFISIGVLLFKNKRDYEHALEDVKEAARDAKDAAKNARDLEKETQGILVDIRKQAKAKLEEIEKEGSGKITALQAIEKKGNEERQKSLEEFERQRKISELLNKGWKADEAEDYETVADCCRQIVEELKEDTNPDLYNNWGVALANLAKSKKGPQAEELFKQTLEKYQKAIEIKPDYYIGYNNWGNALCKLAKSKKGTEAEELLNQAIEKYKKAIEIKQDYFLVYNNWGSLLSDLAISKKGKEAEELLNQAIEKCKKAIEIKPDYFHAHNNWGAALAETAIRKKGLQAEELFNQAIEKFKKAIEIKPDYCDAYNNWGSALTQLAKSKKGKEAEKLYNQAIEKSKKAIEIKPDYFLAYNGWGATLLYLAELKGGKAAEELRRQAEEKCLKAESIKTGEGAYNLACVYARRGNEGKCQEWLKAIEKAGTLPTREHAMADDDLKSVRNKNWFKKLRWKGE